MRMLILTAVVAVTACSSQPPAGQGAGQGAGDVAGEAPAAAAVAAQPVAAADAKPRQFRAPPGYETKERGGTLVYCREEAPLGTRLTTEYCFTQAQLEEIERRNDSMRRDVERGQRVCTSSSVCGGD